MLTFCSTYTLSKIQESIDSRLQGEYVYIFPEKTSSEELHFNGSELWVGRYFGEPGKLFFTYSSNPSSRRYEISFDSINKDGGIFSITYSSNFPNIETEFDRISSGTYTYVFDKKNIFKRDILLIGDTGEKIYYKKK
jgi:hypothetical protein